MTANPSSSANPLGLQTALAPPPPSRFKPVDPLRVLRQHVWLLLAAAIVGGLAGGGLWYVLRQQMPEYTSSSQLVVTPPPSLSSGGTGRAASADEAATFIQNELPFIASSEVLTLVVGSPQVKETTFYRRQGSEPAAIRALQDGALTATSPRGSTLMNLSVTTREPRDAELILSKVIDFYLIRVQGRSTTGSTARSRVFQQQIAEMEREIDGVRRALSSLIATPELINVQRSESQVEYESLVKLKAERLDSYQRALKALDTMRQAEVEGIERPLTAEERDGIERRPELGSIKAEILRLQQMRAVFEDQYGRGHRAVKALDREIAAAQATKEGEVQRLVAMERQAQLPAMESAVASLKGDLDETQSRLALATRRLQELQKQLVEYSQRREELERKERVKADLEDQMNRDALLVSLPDAMRITKQTEPSVAELTFPKVEIVVPGVTLLVLGLVTGLVFVWELLDQRVKSTSDVRMMADAELLGMLPDAGEDPSGVTPVERVVERHPTGLMAEGYRRVRTAVLGKMDRRGYRTLVVVGTGPGAGASSVAHNLATSMALNGRRVLLLDANFRRPTQGELLDIRCEGGLVPLLRGEATLEDSVRPVEGLTLWVLPAGDCRGAMPEMLEGAGFRELLAELESRFDLIVLDCPPALLTTDAQLLAKHVDSITVVVRAGRDKRGMVERTLRQLDGQRADVLGVVLNGVKSSRGGYFRRSYRDYYRYHEPVAGGRGMGHGNTAGTGHGDDVKGGNGNGRGRNGTRRGKAEATGAGEGAEVAADAEIDVEAERL